MISVHYLMLFIFLRKRARRFKLTCIFSCLPVGLASAPVADTFRGECRPRSNALEGTRALSSQFDAVIHFDETRAVEPLERTPTWETAEIPETFPSAL